MSPPKTLCLIAARNLGDITIVSTYFRQLVEQGLADRYVVWTRPATAFLFDGLPNCKLVRSDFPVGTGRGPMHKAFIDMLRGARLVWRERPDCSLDYVGDFRERQFARLAGVCRQLHIGWAPEHAHSRIIRNPLGPGAPLYVVPSDVPNVYAAYQAFNDRLLALRGLSSPGSAAVPSAVRASAEPLAVGLHPFASQDCRKWPFISWTTLVEALLRAGIAPTAFGAPSDLPALQAMFGRFGDQVRLVTGSIPEFAQELGRLDLMVGLDSFSVHMAERLGVDSIFINGANDPTLFSPPRAAVLQSSGGCAAWPCYNKPTCVGMVNEYACIRSVSVNDVYSAITERLLSRRGIKLPLLHQEAA
ncbi:MAG TPA: glycosyltransferase family 9 protein [Ideonella sp.]|uniref:glycosyltransferase family 9 protein n=1 Tax=Ideonella sp. TaxID=1929293 RepID=UPI002C3FF96D|nr:glycosyltransferase family 9 protein [Ideonella sp.]HSI48433.1 glycosyltransferase family 9 protein [Ideonella sp.]